MICFRLSNCLMWNIVLYGAKLILVVSNLVISVGSITSYCSGDELVLLLRTVLLREGWEGGRIEPIHRKNNRYPFLDILGYLKNTHKHPKFGRVRQVPTRELGWEFPGWDLPHFAKFGILATTRGLDFCGYSLNSLKYPLMGICYFFLWSPLLLIAERDDSKQQSIIISRTTLKFHLLSHVNVLSWQYFAFLPCFLLLCLD